MGTTRKALLALPLGLLLASPAAAFRTYSQLRQEHPSINKAVGAMPSSDINGTLNSISALLSRAKVRDLGTGEANGGGLPPNVVIGLIAALGNLSDDLAGGLPSLRPADQYVILQVVDDVAFRRILDLYEGYPGEGCIPALPDHPCTIAPPPVVVRLNALAAELAPVIDALLQSADPPEVGPSSIDGRNLSNEVDHVRDTFGRVSGVENIDYQ